jgi:hypothetical protein
VSERESCYKFRKRLRFGGHSKDDGLQNFSSAACPIVLSAPNALPVVPDAGVAKTGRISAGGQRSEVGRRIDMMKVTTIMAMPPQNSTLCGRRIADQTASGGQDVEASRSASMHARTPERNPVAVAIPRFLSTVIELLFPWSATNTARALLDGQPMAAVLTY